MTFDGKYLKYKDSVPAVDAGQLTIFTMYSMTDNFERKSFQIGIGVSQINIIINLNFTEDYTYNFM